MQSLDKIGSHYRLCIGLSSHSSTTYSGDKVKHESSKQRVFVLMRAPISWPTIVAVSEDQDNHVDVDDSALGFWIWLAVASAMFFGIWRWSMQAVTQKPEPDTPAPSP